VVGGLDQKKHSRKRGALFQNHDADLALWRDEEFSANFCALVVRIARRITHH
jgi:hypothetical protein